jgi:hypothetical protein
LLQGTESIEEENVIANIIRMPTEIREFSTSVNKNKKLFKQEKEQEESTLRQQKNSSIES